MRTEIKDIKKSKYQLKISLSPEELIAYFQKTYEKLAPEVKIAGFRPGKAPRKLIEESIGQARLLSESLDGAIQNSYFESIKKENLMPISAPKVVILTYPNWGLEAPEIESELVFEAEIEVMPKIELKDFSSAKVKKKERSKVKDDDIEKILTHLKRQKATFNEIDRPAKIGDRVEINYEGYVDKVKKDAMSAKNQPLVLGDKTLIPEFEEKLIGLRKAEEKEFSITFPKDYQSKEFASKKAEFKVLLVDLKEVVLPDLDNKFAENFGHKNIPDLKLAIGKSLKDEVDAKTKNELETEVLDRVLPYLKVEVPEGLIEQEIDRIIKGMEKQVSERGLSFDKYLESIKKALPDLRKDMAPTAEKNIKIGFLLGKVIEEQKLDYKDPNAGKKALEIIINKVTK